jgi:putative sigma-54 modulation protein
MQISVTGHHLDITDSLRDYINTKFERLERHFDHITDVHVILENEKITNKAEATFNVSGAKLFAEDHHEDMYAAIDGLTDKLDRQIVKHKEKLKKHR